MPLTPEEMHGFIKQLDDLCREAQALQKRIRTAMATTAREDMPHRPSRPERRKAPRKAD